MHFYQRGPKIVRALDQARAGIIRQFQVISELRVEFSRRKLCRLDHIESDMVIQSLRRHEQEGGFLARAARRQ